MTGLVPFVVAAGVAAFGASLWSWIAPDPADEHPFEGED